MPNQTEELLRQKQEEIEQLKKELRDASRPAALFSTLKKSVKRGVKEFFNREEKIKSLDARVMQLEKELEAAKEENAQKEVILLVVSQGADPEKAAKQENSWTDKPDMSEILFGFAINEEFLPPPIAQAWPVFTEDEFDDDFL